MWAAIFGETVAASISGGVGVCVCVCVTEYNRDGGSGKL